MRTEILIRADLDGYFIEESEVIEMASVLADSYLEDGTYVASFGFLTYEIKRYKGVCKVFVTNGFGYHSWVGGVDMNNA